MRFAFSTNAYRRFPFDEAAARIAALGTHLRPVEGEAERLMAANLAGAAVDAFQDGD